MTSDDFPPEPPQHTPGPWFLFANDHCVGGPFEPGPGDDPDQKTAGVAMCGMRLRTRDETIANARLIAAAPDLLEHLREICDEIAMHFVRRARPAPSGYAPSDGDLVDAIQRMMPGANEAVNAALGIKE